jgi:hypothetical protein
MFHPLGPGRGGGSSGFMAGNDGIFDSTSRVFLKDFSFSEHARNQRIFFRDLIYVVEANFSQPEMDHGTRDS